MARAAQGRVRGAPRGSEVGRRTSADAAAPPAPHGSTRTCLTPWPCLAHRPKPMAGKQQIVTRKEKQGHRTAKTGAKAHKPAEDNVRKPPPHPATACARTTACAPATACAHPCCARACVHAAPPRLTLARRPHRKPTPSNTRRTGSCTDGSRRPVGALESDEG